MDIQLISELLKELLMENDRVSLPGIGSFIAEPSPSVFSDKATVIHPPFRRVTFRNKEIWNDGLLEKRVSQKSGLDLEVAKIELNQFIASLNTELELKKRIDFPSLGYFKISERGTTSFIVDKDLFVSKDSFGLEPLKLKTLEKPGIVEQLKPIKYKSVPEKEATKDIVTEKEDTSFKSSSTSLRLIIIFLVVFIVIALMIIFSDQLKPLWELILYNKEDREILKSFYS